MMQDGSDFRCVFTAIRYTFLEKQVKQQGTQRAILGGRADDLPGELNVRLSIRKLNSGPLCWASLTTRVLEVGWGMTPLQF